jgi:hypothetical protein
VPIAVYVGIVPMTLVVAAHLMPGNDIEWLTMCLMAGGGQFYFNAISFNGTGDGDGFGGGGAHAAIVPRPLSP